MISTATSFLGSLYRSKILRILILVFFILLIATYAVYCFWLMPWLNRTISETYLQQTGHHLEHDKLVVNLRLCHINLGHLKDTTHLWEAEALDIDLDCKRSIHERGFFANKISIKNLIANPRQEANGAWNYNDILKHVAANKKTATTPIEKTPPVYVRELVISNAKINTNAQLLDNMPMVLSPLDIKLDNIDLRKKSSSKLEVKTLVNQTVPLDISGTIDVANLHAELDTRVQHLPFKWFSPLLKPYVALDILRGVINERTHISLVNGLPQKMLSSGTLTDLKVRPTTMDHDAVKWKNLEWQSAEIDLHEKNIHVPQLLLDQFDGQLIITKERTTNIQAMIIKPVPEAPTPKEQAAVPANQPAPESQPWKFVVDHLKVNNSALGFFDESLNPSFTVIIQQFGGEITDIANDPNHLASIDLNGNVDGYAPVKLSGKAKVFIEQPELEVLFSFQKMDMGAFSPYSAEYAGWRIKKGLLSVDLNYHYDHGRILGKNHLVIDHLEFGEKVRSPHIIDLPLRLGLSLLTDENGIAVLDADITGNPKDPQFNVRETIWRAFRNTLKKVATAPFRLIANLLKTKEDLGRIEFTAGESQLSEQAVNKLKLLTQAMQKRPKLRLTIHGIYDEKADLLALQYEQVNSSLQKIGVSRDSITAHDENWAKGLAGLYRSKAADVVLVNAEEQYKALALQETVLPERLNNLAHERAQTVKQYFVLQLGVPSEMLLLDSENDCDKTNVCVSSAVLFTLED